MLRVGVAAPLELWREEGAPAQRGSGFLFARRAFFSKINSVMDRGKKFSVFVKSSLINYAHRDYAVHSERESFILYAVGEMKCPSEFCTASLKHHLE